MAGYIEYADGSGFAAFEFISFYLYSVERWLESPSIVYGDGERRKLITACDAPPRPPTHPGAYFFRFSHAASNNTPINSAGDLGAAVLLRWF